MLLLSFGTFAQTVTPNPGPYTPMAQKYQYPWIKTTGGVWNTGKFVQIDSAQFSGITYVPDAPVDDSSTQAANTRWIRQNISPGTPGTPTSVWQFLGNYSPTDPTLGRIGFIDSFPLSIITDNEIRITIPDNGIKRSAGLANKVLMIDTITKNVYYADAGGGTYALDTTKIPLSGTLVGKPVTADLELTTNGDFENKIYSYNYGNSTERKLVFGQDFLSMAYDSSNLQILNNYISANSLSPIFKGVRGSSDFSPNYDYLTYVQKLYVDRVADSLRNYADSNSIPITGTLVGKPITGDIEFGTDYSTFISRRIYSNVNDGGVNYLFEIVASDPNSYLPGIFYTDSLTGRKSFAYFQNKTAIIGSSDNDGSQLGVGDTSILLTAGGNSKGIIGSQYFPNKDSLTFSQMKDIADSAATKQNLITLTTTGTSGAATFTQSTGALNVPNYTAGSNVDTLFYNVKDFGAVGDSTTDDRAAVISAITAANTAGGGVLFFPAGRYRISDSILLTNSIRIMGVSSAGAIGTDFDWSGSTTAQNNIAPVQYSSVIYCGTNKSVFVLDTASNGSHPFLKVENLAFVGDTLGTATYGSFITVRGNIQDVAIENCSFYGGYIQVNLQSAMYQKVIFNHFSSPTLYALLMNNDQRPDTGDGFIMGNVFSSGKHTTTTAKAIYWLGGGGRIITSNKFDATSTTKNTQFIYDIDGTNPLAVTSVINISSNSFENYQTGAIRFNMVNVFYYMQILNNQFAGYSATSNAIDLTGVFKANINSNTITNTSATALGAIKLTNCLDINMYSNIFEDYTSLYTTTPTYLINTTNQLSGTSNNTREFAVINGSSGASAKSRLRLTNNASQGAYLSLWGSGTAFANKFIIEGDKSILFLSDASTASGGTSKIQFGTSGYNIASAPQFTFDGNGRFGIGQVSPTEKLEVNGNILLNTAGNKIKIATGTNASVGTATLVAGTVTVSTTAALTASKIFVTVVTPGGTQGFISVPTITNATSFVINSTSATETSTVNWWIIN